MTTDERAAEQGRRWGARAGDWAALTAGFSAPAWAASADATAIGAGTRVLDVGCGSGELCALAAGRGASVSGLDASGAMVELARRRVPGADLRVGAMERLPWPDGAFDVVTAVNALAFAADPAAALAELARVTRPGGQVVVCGWDATADNELMQVMAALRELGPPPPGPPPPALGAPDVLAALARRSGLEPLRDDAVDVPFTAPDRATLLRALLAPGMAAPVLDHAGEPAVRAALAGAAAPHERADGSYRLRNRFRLLVARAGPGAH
jgi:SAM-dependent methyltransferase